MIALTRNQMKILEDLGLDTRKSASLFQHSGMVVEAQYVDINDPNYLPRYTVDDLLSRIPDVLKYKGEGMRLSIERMGKRYCVQYVNYDGLPRFYATGEMLLTTLYSFMKLLLEAEAGFDDLW